MEGRKQSSGANFRRTIDTSRANIQKSFEKLCFGNSGIKFFQFFTCARQFRLFGWGQYFRILFCAEHMKLCKKRLFIGQQFDGFSCGASYIDWLINCKQDGQQ